MAKKQAAAVPVADLVRMALLNVANAADGVKLSGKGGLFASAAGANKEAMDECLNAAAPLLTNLRKEGKSEVVGLAPAGFERIARELPEEKVGPLAKAVAAAVPLAARIDFLQAVIGRTPLAAAELTPLLDEAVTAAKAEHDARVEAARRRREAEEASLAALERARALILEHRQNRLAALRREYEAEGGKAAELPEPAAKADPPRLKIAPAEPDEAPEPTTDEQKEFRRYTADRLAAAWRDELAGGREEGCNALETAIWNIRGMKVIGEAGQRVAFDGRLHESDAPVPPGAAARVVRPGWLLKVDDEDYVALRAAVEPV